MQVISIPSVKVKARPVSELLLIFSNLKRNLC